MSFWRCLQVEDLMDLSDTGLMHDARNAPCVPQWLPVK